MKPNKWTTDPLHDDGDVPPHLDSSLPEIPFHDFIKMGKQQKRWWKEHRKAYKQELADEKLHRKLKKYGY